MPAGRPGSFSDDRRSSRIIDQRDLPHLDN
jgi:hypothetical protein